MEAALDSGAKAKHIILVHGVCHGGWSWYKVAAGLRSAAGHGCRVHAPDLAASGTDDRRLPEVATFSEYTGPLLDVLRSLPAGEKAVLVGHSLGGLSVALASEMFPDKVAVAAFLSAYMPDCASPPSHVLIQERQRHGSRCEASLHPDLTWEGVALCSGAASGGGGEVGGEHGDGRAETKEEKNGEAGRLRSGSASGGDSEAGGAHGDEGPENGGVRERGLRRRQSHCQAGRAGARGAHGSSPGAAHEGMRWGSSCRHTTRRSPLLHTSSELHLLVLHLGIH
ncbi:unnamed protein product [Triticum turgidum subsp. durum]|uniref:AB hydrolase-1 domain-containing protein n=1 Tax=Triticum turgidum subsp. durum TaxID=4567 RepID=A0A9R0T047_TRITD|nr:unnamed protein product [Triticum turgidum subsp. durum]